MKKKVIKGRKFFGSGKRKNMKMFAILMLSFALILNSYGIQSAFGAWGNVPLGGGGYVTGLVSNSEGTIYCRTDVGGAYRWIPSSDGNNGVWKNLTDTMVPCGTSGAGGLMNVDGIGTDSQDPNILYIGAGSELLDGFHGVFVSYNKGDTWTQVNSTVRMDGNGSYRAFGDRIAVDPVDNNIVWYASKFDGLHKGVKNGSTWTWTQIPTALIPLGLEEVGVSFVVCDKNDGVNPITYAGVYDPNNAAARGIYKSMDRGANWTKLTNVDLPAPRHAQVTKNGTLYITGGTSGVAKMTRGGTLSMISTLPVKDSDGTDITYNGLALDPNDADGNTVYVSQSKNPGGKIFRSTDGGTNWLIQNTTFNEGPQTADNHARTEPDGTPCMLGQWFTSTSALLINPKNSNELWLSDLYGVCRTKNAQAIGTNPGAWWYMLLKGLEETVVHSLKNAPSGAKLLTGLGDVSGYRYNDTTVRPYGTGGNSFKTPTGGNNTSIDFCESDPNIFVRSWVKNNVSGSAGSGAVSLDGGKSWLAFGQVAAGTVANSPTPGWESWDVGTYLAKQKAKSNIVTLIVASTNTDEYSMDSVTFDSKEATDTSKKPKIVINGGTTLNPIADTMVSGASATTNYGNSQTLTVRYYYGQASYSRWIFLKFDLSSVGSISSAVLQLSRQASTSNTTVFPVNVYACDNTTWIEGDGGTDNLPAGELTWNNKPYALTSHGDPQAISYYDGNTPLAGGRIAISSVDKNVIVWAPIKNHIRYSTDRGATWAMASGDPNSQITGIYTNGTSIDVSGQPLTADRGNGYFYSAKFGGEKHLIYRSADNGATWNQVSTVTNNYSYTVRTPQIVAAPVSPSFPNGGDVWLCDDGSYNGQGGGLWRSTNSAESWTKNTSVAKVTQVTFGKAAAGSGYTVFINGYKDGVKGLYKSDDYGITWTKLEDPTICQITSLAGDRQNYGNLFVGTNGRGTLQYQNPTPTPTPAPLLLEGESQTWSSTDGSQTLTFTGSSGGSYCRVAANGVGDYGQFTQNVEQGMYNIKVGIIKSSSGGIFQTNIGGTNQGSPVDTYASTASVYEVDLGTKTFSNTGAQTFRFNVTGKNTSSTEHTFRIDYVKLISN